MSNSNDAYASNPSAELTDNAAHESKPPAVLSDQHPVTAVPVRLSSSIPAGWMESLERRKATRDCWIIAITGLAILVTAFLVYQAAFLADNESYFSVRYIGYALGYLGALVFILAPMRWFTARSTYRERRAAEEAQNKVKESVRESNPEPTMQNLLYINRTEMSAYHQLTINQAAKSFRHSQIAMYCGFALVGACILFVALPNTDPTTKFSAAGLGIVSAAVSGYITRTFLKSHSLSISQLNRFFEQPLISSYLLTAERIAGHLNDESRDNAMAEVVSQALRVADRDSDLVEKETSGRPRFMKQPQYPLESPSASSTP